MKLRCTSCVQSIYLKTKALKTFVSFVVVFLTRKTKKILLMKNL